jgi:putative transposase
MPRRARILFPGIPHHVTQRGNHRQRVFFAPGDHAAYLSLLKEHAAAHSVEVVAYCLMPNHVHLVVVPARADGLHRLFKSVHGRYAQRVNRMREQTGHLWQGRYFSSALDSAYLLNAVRYVELNPVRARLVDRAEDFDWSSAATHCGLRRDSVVDALPRLAVLAGIGHWSRWLSEGLANDCLHTLRRNGSQNLPCGSPDFVERLEKLTGLRLRYAPHGGSRAKRIRSSCAA